MPELPEETFTISIGSVAFDCRDGKVISEDNKPDRASGTVPAEVL